jgi:hypothetical protein
MQDDLGTPCSVWVSGSMLNRTASSFVRYLFGGELCSLQANRFPCSFYFGQQYLRKADACIRSERKEDTLGGSETVRTVEVPSVAH